MAKNRYLNTKFWDDNYIIDLDPIEKLLFVYCLTNPLTSISGVYEIAIRRMAFDTGIDKDMIIKILGRFEDANKIKYHGGWLAIKNFIKHQAVNPKIQKGIEVDIKKCPEDLIMWINYSLSKPIDSLSKTLNYSNLNLNSNLNSNSNNIYSPAEPDNISEIIDYLNLKAKTAFKKSSAKTKTLINARLKNGFTIADFKKVIDNKCSDWINTDMSKYLRPETLFGQKFESYLNENLNTKMKNIDVGAGEVNLNEVFGL